jgi:tetratricopeptide (TPR) repeat protein
MAIGAFSTADMTERWPAEQPVLFNRFLNERDAGETHGSGYTDLAIWEFVKANYADRPLCFAAVPSPWLAARGQIAGLVLLYPRRDDAPSPLTVEAILASVGLDGVERGRDGIANTISLAAVPIAQALCAQGRYEESADLVAVLRTMCPDSPALGLAAQRIESRQGHRDAAVKLSQDCLRQADGDAERGRIELRVRQDLDSLSDENAFWIFIDAGETSVEAMEKRQDMAMKLWAADELTVLMEGYEAVRAFSPDDLDALYQLAAAYAQLGDLPRAHERLKRWIEVSQLPAMQVARKLFEDGRFALLQTYQAPQEADSEEK